MAAYPANALAKTNRLARATLQLQYLKAAKNAAFTVAASETTASVAASASQGLLTPDSLPDLKTRWLLLTNTVMVCKVHDGWRVGKVVFASAKKRLAC